MSVNISPRAQVDVGKGLWRMNVKRFGHRVFRRPVLKVLKEGLLGISLLWEKNDGSFSPTSPNAGPTTLALFGDMMDKIAASARTAQNAISRDLARCTRKYQRRVRLLEGRPRTWRIAQKLRKNKDKLRTLELKDKEDREMLIKARPIEIGPESAEFWVERDVVIPDRTIRGLYKPDGKITRKSKKMLKVALDFYTDLFSQAKTSPASHDNLLARLPSANFAGVDRAVSTAEVEAVVAHWALGRTSGVDGIPLEFFKKFKHVKKKSSFTFVEVMTIVTTILVETAKYSCKMPVKWSEGCIKIMYKKGDTGDIANYRPLSMINTIYKLVTSVILNRLSGPFATCIGEHQTGFMAGRSIFDNIKLAQALIDRADQLGTPLYIALLDQKKAYDMVDHGFLWKALTRYGVPQGLIQAIKWAYEGAQSRVEINRFLTDPIKLTRGVRQGDPLSCLLFNAVIEPLALLLKDCGRLPGFTDRRGRVHKVGMYADDTAVILTRLQEFAIVLKRYALYSEATGGQLNLLKTVIVAAGVKEAPPKCGVVTVLFQTPATYLGIPIGSNICTKSFKAELLAKLKAKIAKWERKRHAVSTKILIAKSCLDSLLWHSLRCLHFTNEELKEFQSVIRAYIWTTKRPLSFFNTARPRSEGGIAEMDLFTVRNTLAIYWVRQLRRDRIWASLVTEILTHGLPTESIRKITMPWGQVWSSKGATITPAVNHFWPYWEQSQLHRPREPETAEEVFGTHFWFHPGIYRIYKFNWYVRNWGNSWDGMGCPQPVRTLGDLRSIWLGEVKVSQTYKKLVDKLFLHLPTSWKDIIGPAHSQSQTPPPPFLFDHVVVFNRSLTWIPLESPMLRITYHISKSRGLPIGWGRYFTPGQLDHGPADPQVQSMECGLPDLLTNFRDLCRIGDVKIDHIADTTIWGSTWVSKIDKPRFSDLYWKLILGKVVAGDFWLKEKADCPICHTTQLAEHLFWDCPVAQRMWVRLKHIWITITGSNIPDFPDSWPKLLLTGVTMRRRTWGGEIDQRRWRILFGEVIWAVWIQKCRWSHNEHKFGFAAILRLFKEAMALRVGRDRLYARSTSNREKRATVCSL